MNQPAKSNPRIPRELDSRAADARPEFQWKAPDTLPTPDPIPGVVFRYIRVATMGTSDAPNVSKMRREGWEPVQAKDHPEIATFADAESKFRDNIEIGGLLLCKNSTEAMKQREAYFNGQTQGQMQSVDQNLMKENDPRMPLFKESKSKVSFGSGGA